MPQRYLKPHWEFNLNICVGCENYSVKKYLDFGLQTITNRFLKAPISTQEEFKHPLQLGFCDHCGLTQLLNAAPIEEVRTRFDWVRYNEAEGHLDDLVETLYQLPDVTTQASILGLSENDTSSLLRLNKKGFYKAAGLSLKSDLGMDVPLDGLGIVQEYFTDETIKEIKKIHHPNIIIARNILEHARNPLKFLTALHTLLQPDGYIVFEVPDNETFFSNYDYSIVWEEHILYFTPFSFLNFIKNNGFDIQFFKIYPHSMENSLVMIARVKPNDSTPSHDGGKIKNEYDQILKYSSMFLTQKDFYRKVLLSYKKMGKKIALMGASHLACHFINLMEIADTLEFIVDDHPCKSGLFMPGSQLSILPSRALIENKIDICLLSLSSESEKKVIIKKSDFIESGGMFFSIFPTSEIALKE